MGNILHFVVAISLITPAMIAMLYIAIRICDMMFSNWLSNLGQNHCSLSETKDQEFSERVDAMIAEDHFFGDELR